MAVARHHGGLLLARFSGLHANVPTDSAVGTFQHYLTRWWAREADLDESVKAAGADAAATARGAACIRTPATLPVGTASRADKASLAVIRHRADSSCDGAGRILANNNRAPRPSRVPAAVKATPPSAAAGLSAPPTLGTTGRGGLGRLVAEAETEGGKEGANATAESDPENPPARAARRDRGCEVVELIPIHVVLRTGASAAPSLQFRSASLVWWRSTYDMGGTA